jgi:hypothetical protein
MAHDCATSKTGSVALSLLTVGFVVILDADAVIDGY